MKKKIKKIIMTFAMVLTVMAAVKASTIEAQAAGQFDPMYYAQTYPDVVAVLGTDAMVLYNHYINFGQKEGRIPYVGAQPGEIVEGIANATAAAPAVQTTVDIGNGPYWLYPDGNEVSKETFLQRKQELQQQFDAEGYVHVGWTEEQVQTRLYSLKEKYPEGTVVGICQSGAETIRQALYGSEYVFCVGCVYRGEDVNDEWIYVDGLARPVATGDQSISAKDILRVGDMVFSKSTGAGHVAVVLSHNDKGITVVESNWNGDEKMHWGRFIRWEVLDSDYISGTRTGDTRTMIWHFKY